MCPIRITFRIRISRTNVHWNNLFAHFFITAKTWKSAWMQSLGQALVFCVSVNEGKYQSGNRCCIASCSTSLHVNFIHLHLFISIADHANSCIAVLPLFRFSISTQVQRPSSGKPDCKHLSVPEILVLSVIHGSGNLPDLTTRRLSSPTCFQKGNHRFLQVSKEAVARCWCWLIL